MMRLADNIPGKPHRWADAIGAWARGELVQWRYASTEATDADWRDCDYPSRGMPNWSYPGIEYRAALSSHHEDGGRAATDAQDAKRWRQWRSGKPLIFTFAHPTPKKPNGTITISYGPNNEPGYAAALDDAVDKLIAAAATAAGEGTMSFGKRTTSADTASGHGIPDFTPTPEQADTAGPGQERHRDAQHKVAATAEGCGKVANGGDARLASGGCPNLSANVALGGEKGEAVAHAVIRSNGPDASPRLIADPAFERRLREAPDVSVPLFAAPVEARMPDDEAFDAELGRIAMRFVDRAGDVHPGIDDAETICAAFHKAMSDAIMKRFPSARGPAVNQDVQRRSRCDEMS